MYSFTITTLIVAITTLIMVELHDFPVKECTIHDFPVKECTIHDFPHKTMLRK